MDYFENASSKNLKTKYWVISEMHLQIHPKKMKFRWIQKCISKIHFRKILSGFQGFFLTPTRCTQKFSYVWKTLWDCFKGIALPTLSVEEAPVRNPKNILEIIWNLIFGPSKTHVSELLHYSEPTFFFVF